MTAHSLVLVYRVWYVAEVPLMATYCESGHGFIEHTFVRSDS